MNITDPIEKIVAEIAAGYFRCAECDAILGGTCVSYIRDGGGLVCCFCAETFAALIGGKP